LTELNVTTQIKQIFFPIYIIIVSRAFILDLLQIKNYNLTLLLKFCVLNNSHIQKLVFWYFIFGIL